MAAHFILNPNDELLEAARIRWSSFLAQSELSSVSAVQMFAKIGRWSRHAARNPECLAVVRSPNC
jgi:hypothetical protein